MSSLHHRVFLFFNVVLISFIFSQESYTIIAYRNGQIRERPQISKVVMKLTIGDTIEVFHEHYDGYFKASSKGAKGWINEVLISKALPREWKKKASIEIKQTRILNKNKRLTNKYGRAIADKIIDGEIWIGMTDDMAKASIGYPDDINRTVTRYGTHEQWVYNKKDMNLYFDDGVLTSWQE